MFYACSNKGGNAAPNSSQKAMLVGTWRLQQEHLVQYVDAAKTADTIVNTSVNNTSKTQFNADDTFISTALYQSGNTGSLSAGLSVAVDTAKGTYSFAGTVFDTSVPIAGFAAASGVSFFGTTGEVPTIKIISHTVVINKLTMANLNIHAEYDLSYTTSSGSQVHKTVGDYYYTR
jgi:hypothetical protein